MNIEKLLNKPKVISVVADVHQGKSMLLYHIVHQLNEKYECDLYTYGLRLNVDNATQVHSTREIEQIKNSIIVIDEFSSLFDLDNRKCKRQVENTLRLINHNNNILILCGVPENFKKFISGKVDVFILKKVTLADCINGSRLKDVITSYKGEECGQELLNLPVDKAIMFDGLHYKKFFIPYYEQYDTKRTNEAILRKQGTSALNKELENKRFIKVTREKRS